MDAHLAAKAQLPLNFSTWESANFIKPALLARLAAVGRRYVEQGCVALVIMGEMADTVCLTIVMRCISRICTEARVAARAEGRRRLAAAFSTRKLNL